ncbi:protein pygopus-like [Ischnura elegans]|uniref:protein pygopus-like n=1 Tax=Ischnura elegans TaxID=197161 RepID=UPI001ED8AC06|nr:protein pygopus-like [Ischnura elegans]
MSHNAGMAPFVSMSRVRNHLYFQYPGGEGQGTPPMRNPCYHDERNDKLMAGSCGLPLGNLPGEFKSPVGMGMGPGCSGPAVGGRGTPESPGNPKKKRRTAASSAAPVRTSPVMSELLPPPLTGYGDTIVASNPFDDTPPQQSPNMTHSMLHTQNHLNHHHHHHHHHHMGGGGGGMGPVGMGPMSGGMNNISGPSGMVQHPVNSPNHMGGGPPGMMGGGMVGGMPQHVSMHSMPPHGAPSMQPHGPPPPLPPHGHPHHSVPPHHHSHPGHSHHGPSPHPHGFAGHPGMGPRPMPVSAGKVYPPDQPMVFNPQNPNAPPIYPCGICHKEVHDNDQALLCESGCNFWFHRVCTGLTEAAYQLLTAEVYAEWVCDKCLSSKNIPLVKFKP